MMRRTDPTERVPTAFMPWMHWAMASVLVLSALLLAAHTVAQPLSPLSVSCDKKYGQVEVGGPFVGVEFHRSRPLPSRISFYYPVANSIDLSTDYWKREDSRPMALGVQVDERPKQWIGRDAWRYELSPNTVTFSNEDSILATRLSYEFCLTQPAMVVSVVLRNISGSSHHLRVYTHLLSALRTCQTFARKDSALMSVHADGQAIVARFSDSDTKRAEVFVMNEGEAAARALYDANALAASDDGTSNWIDSSFPAAPGALPPPKRTRSLAAYEYEKEVRPGDSLIIVQVIGSANDTEAEKIIATLTQTWRADVKAYNTLVENKSALETEFFTGDRRLDHSVEWSKAILAANAHYINGNIEPMPCPAEYNFFFTHDVLMTNLGAVNFDCDRVKQNLLYIASLAQHSVIPHAYYWRDDGFKTELCTPSNWNHLWFIEVSASYLRHSLDTTTVRRLYPLITKSLSEVMTQLKPDHLMYAFRPDWWDIGWKEGPRTYITTLSIRAIEDYLFIASMVDKNNSALLGMEHDADVMRTALRTRLWDPSLKYLINYNGTDKDTHKYMGSLLAPAFGLLDARRSQELVRSAEKDLLAPGVGIRAVMPADFATDSSVKYFKFAGEEAGKAYTYINGGVWPHNNAWYALALHAVGRTDEALTFVRNTMTVEGVAESPNGIPAMYEYRFSDQASPRYGEIDKPSFLWAGGFYLYTMYTLAGMNDNPWNLSISEDRAKFDSTIHFSYTFGSPTTVSMRGKGPRLAVLAADRKIVPSLVLPLEKHGVKLLDVNFGDMTTPYVKSANAIVHSVLYLKKIRTLECRVSSFRGHATTVEIVSKRQQGGVFLNQKALKNIRSKKNFDGSYTHLIRFEAGESIDTLILKW
jgi:hypothetical protein